MSDDSILADMDSLRQLEALLFAAEKPMTKKELAGFLQPETDIQSLLDILVKYYAPRGINLVQRGESWAFRTAVDLREKLHPLRKKERRLSRAALETLAIIAYHQPITRAEIDSIRSVSSSRTVFDILLEEEWIAPAGHKAVPGKPTLWKTTDHFLDTFGLNSCDDLPGVKELAETGFILSSQQWLAMEHTAPDAEEGEGAEGANDEMGEESV
jgi:segregation and condensation protein B